MKLLQKLQIIFGESSILLDGIVYFADDDNIYSLELFDSLREISRFGAWPVAMLAQSKNKAVLEGPVCNGSLIIGWHTNEKSNRLRRFHVDMSGFAFNSTILWSIKFDIVIVSRYYVRRKILKSGWMIRRLSKKSEFIVFKCSVIYIFGH